LLIGLGGAGWRLATRLTWSDAPTWALIELSPLAQWEYPIASWRGELYMEVSRRIKRMNERQADRLGRRALSWDSDAVRKFAMRARVSPRMFERLARPREEDLVHTPRRWVRGVPLRVRFQPPRWSGDPAFEFPDVRTRFLWVAPDFTAKRALSHRYGGGYSGGLVQLPVQPWSDGTRVIDVVPPGVSEVCYDAHLTDIVLNRETGRATSLRLLWSGVERDRIEWVDTIDEFMTPVSSPDIDDAVRASVGLDTGAGHDVRVVFEPRRPAVDGLTIAVRIELLDDASGRVLGSAIYWNRQPSGEEAEPVTADRNPVPLWGEVEDMAPYIMKRPAETFRFRVIGDPDVALRDFEGERYWVGSFETTIGGY